MNRGLAQGEELTYRIIGHAMSGYREDIIVANEVILELKSVEQLHPLHDAQLLTYLRLSGCRVGLPINFNTASLSNGIRRRVL